ncbi:MAG TPA: beta-galactosidase trimerization domain-containing protein [Tepidisphaeraceae bacterium]|jgi:hypothetical protein|nr:beta-galactosidase trimerization domain-containing protein [Tepidisphaeraceae bacterium]
MNLRDGYLLPPALWSDGKFPSHGQYKQILRRGRLFYSLDIDETAPVGPAIVKRPCNLLYHTALCEHRVIPKDGGWRGFGRNERLLQGVKREREYIASLHDVGIPVIVYQNDNNFDSTQFNEAEIAEMSAELEPFTWAFSNPGRQFACTNKAGWRKLLIDRLKIRVGEYGADGVFWDNCTPFIHCRCKFCRDDYARQTGGDLLSDMGSPQTIVADMRVFEYIGAHKQPRDLVPIESPRTMRYLEWRIDCAIDFYRSVRDQVEKAICRKIIYTSNGHVGIAEQTAIIASGVFDMVFSEDGFTAPPASNAFNLRLGSALTNGEGCPFIITRVMESAPTSDMVKTLSAEARALGGQADFWDFNYREDPALAEAARSIREFHRELADSLYGVERDFNDIAIVYSWRSDLWTSAADSPAKMAAALLEDLNQPLDILIADRPPDAAKIARYRLLIVPHLEVLSDEWFDAIHGFLNKGGKVVATGNTAAEKWHGNGCQYFPQRVEKDYARSRRMIGMHTGFQRPTGPWPEAIDRALPEPSVSLEKAQPLLTINRTRLPDGEAIHLVNRFCNVFPAIATSPRKQIVLRLRPAQSAKRITWICPDDAEREIGYEIVDQHQLRIPLPTLSIAGIVRVYYAS